MTTPVGLHRLPQNGQSRDPKDLKKIVQVLEQETNTRVSTKTIKRFIKKTVMSGNAFANRPRQRLLPRSMNAAKS